MGEMLAVVTSLLTGTIRVSIPIAFAGFSDAMRNAWAIPQLVLVMIFRQA